MDIPDPLAETYFAMMPIHEKLRGRDFATTRNYLRVSLCNIHDELIARMDRAAVQRALLADARHLTARRRWATGLSLARRARWRLRPVDQAANGP